MIVILDSQLLHSEKQTLHVFSVIVLTAQITSDYRSIEARLAPRPRTFSRSCCDARSSWSPFFTQRLHSPTYMLSPTWCSQAATRSLSQRENGMSKSLQHETSRVQTCSTNSCLGLFSSAVGSGVQFDYIACTSMRSWRLTVSRNLWTSRAEALRSPSAPIS